MLGFALFCLIVGAATMYAGHILGRTATPPDIWIDDGKDGFEVSGQHQAMTLGAFLVLTGGTTMIAGIVSLILSVL